MLPLRVEHGLPGGQGEGLSLFVGRAAAVRLRVPAGEAAILIRKRILRQRRHIPRVAAVAGRFARAAVGVVNQRGQALPLRVEDGFICRQRNPVSLIVGGSRSIRQGVPADKPAMLGRGKPVARDHDLRVLFRKPGGHAARAAVGIVGQLHLTLGQEPRVVGRILCYGITERGSRIEEIRLLHPPAVPVIPAGEHVALAVDASVACGGPSRFSINVRDRGCRNRGLARFLRSRQRRPAVAARNLAQIRLRIEPGEAGVIGIHLPLVLDIGQRRAEGDAIVPVAIPAVKPVIGAGIRRRGDGLSLVGIEAVGHVLRFALRLCRFARYEPVHRRRLVARIIRFHQRDEGLPPQPLRHHGQAGGRPIVESASRIQPFHALGGRVLLVNRRCVAVEHDKILLPDDFIILTKFVVAGYRVNGGEKRVSDPAVVVVQLPANEFPAVCKAGRRVGGIGLPEGGFSIIIE